MQTTIENELKNLAESVLASSDFFLTGAEVKGTNPPEVWVYVDGAERGINMDECAEVSNELGFLLDAHELFDGRYRLNVSSPGLSRPLVDPRQYPKNVGRRVKVKYKDAEGYHKVNGTLQETADAQITISDNEQIRTLSFDQIVETKVVPSLK